MARTIVDPKYLPWRFPLVSIGMLWYLFLDHIDAPGWAWGGVGVLWLLFAVTSWCDYWTAIKEPPNESWRTGR